MLAIDAQPLFAEKWASSESLDSIMSNSSKPYPFRCLKCGEINPRRVSAVVTSPQSCVVCSGKKVVEGINDLSAHQIAKEVSPLNTVDITRITPRAEIDVLWRCSAGHDYTMPPASRVTMHQNCPYCSNQRVLTGYNDALTTRPDFASLLSPRGREQILTLTAGSNKEIEWECSNGHFYMRSPNIQWDRRNKRMRLCPSCLRSRQSYGESELGDWLESKGFTVLRNDRKLIAPYELDFVLPHKSFAVEFNGTYWHSDQVIYSKYGITAQEYHERKAKSCNSKGYELFFVWSDDFNNRRTEVENSLYALLVGGEPDSILTTLSKG